MKCDCGERPHGKENCRVSEKVEPVGEVAANGANPAPESGAPNVRVCCCSHGARCVCALKKESLLDPVPEQDFNDLSRPPSFSVRKPRLLTAQSEKTLTVFTKGHHKPVHKHNDAAHKCGIPYPIPIPHSVPGHSNRSKEIARRSTDSLPALDTREPVSTQLQESISSAQQDVRLVRSEHGSPKRAIPAYEGFDGVVSPLDLSFLGYNHGMPSPLPDEYSHYHSAGAFEPYYTPPDEMPPVLSAGLVSPVIDWSGLDLPLENRAYSGPYTQPPSYAFLERHNLSRSGLTTSSSGDVSEVDDYISHYPMHPEPMPPASPEISDSHVYPLRSTTSYMSIPHASISPDGSITRNHIDSFLQHTTASPTELEEPHSGESFGSNGLIGHALTVQDAQKLAHSGILNEAVPAPALPTPLDDLDPLWAASYQVNEVPYDQEGGSINAWPNR